MLSSMWNTLKYWYCIFIITFLSCVGNSALAVPTISVSEIKPGMKGYGLTVFRGTKPERFDVEVISIVPNFLLKQDIILIRCNHPVTDDAGVIGGMSGSPIYFDNRLAGALAYGWQFSKEPIAGVTPIANMLDVLKRKPRMASVFFHRKGTILKLAEHAGASFMEAAKDSFFNLFSKSGNETMLPSRTPLSLGGFSASAQKLLGDALSNFGIEAMMGGGSSKGVDGPTSFEPGSSIGVQLIRGDMSAVGIGTVTYVEGHDVLAFGHPMFNLGEGYFPVTTATIHAVISSIARSNKLGSPLNEAGSLTQDRTACIAARTDKSAAMIPVIVTVNDPENRRKATYNTEIISHRILTPQLMQAALDSIVEDAASDAEDVTVQMKGVLKIKGRPPVTLSDSGASRRGLGAVTPYFLPTAVVGAVLDNPFESVSIESVNLDISLLYRLEDAVVIAAYVTASNPDPGDTVNVYVRLMKYDDKEQVITVPVTIPMSAAGKSVEIEVSGGGYTQPVTAEPRNLDEAMKNVEKMYPPKSLVIQMDVEKEGVAVQGLVLDQLPLSAINTMKPQTGFDRFDQFDSKLIQVVGTPYLIEGKQSFKLNVANRRPK
jgi:hypothetical protein